MSSEEIAKHYGIPPQRLGTILSSTPEEMEVINRRFRTIFYESFGVTQEQLDEIDRQAALPENQQMISEIRSAIEHIVSSAKIKH